MGSRYHGEDPVHKQEPAPASEKSFGSHWDMPVENFDLDLPETIMDSDHGPISTTIEENCSNITFPSSPICHVEKPESTVESVSTNVVNEVSHVDLLGTSTLKIESVDPFEKTVGIERDSQIEKDDEEGDAWEPEEASKEISGSNPSLTSEGPGSFKSLNGKSVSNGSSNRVLVPGSAAGDVNTILKDDPVVIINKSGNGPPVLNGGVECPPGTMPKHSFTYVVGVKQGSSNSTSHTTPTSV